MSSEVSVGSRSARVLVIDSSLMIGDAISAALESGGHAVIVAHSEEEGLDAVHGDPFDVVFLHRGFSHDITSELVRTARLKAAGVMIVLLCSHELREAERNQFRLGADQIVCKPLNPLEIRAVVSRSLQERRILPIPGRPRILVVDDDEIVLESVSDVLKGAAYDVTATLSPLEALGLLKEQTHDVLITDLMMDELDGMELIRSARMICPSMLSVVMTGCGSKDAAIAAVKAGAYDFLEKPLTPDQLRQTISRAWRAIRSEFENQRLLAELKRSNRELQGEIAERKKMQVSLARSDRMASIGLLAAGVAHEINNPLTYVLYSLESLAQDLPQLVDLIGRYQRILEEEVGQDKVFAALGEVPPLASPDRLKDLVYQLTKAVEGAHRVRDIVRDLKTFSRVEQDKQAPVRLDQVIEGAANMSFNEFRYRARFVKEYGNVPPVLASDGRLSQVFLNLLVNAAHSIEEGDVEHNEIRVRTWTEGEEVLAEVRDTGEGIADEHLEHLFEPFFTTKEAGVGSGLGLSICENIVTSYGGKIDVESKLGQGTRFIVHLPMMTAQQSAPEENKRIADPMAAKPEEPTRRGRILVVDDEPTIALFIARYLSMEHEVVVASSGVEGQRILEEDTAFDLILCDLQMPNLSGMELYAWMEEKCPDVAARTVFMTGGAFTQRARNFLDQVPNQRLEKPFELKQLTELMQDRINSHRKG